MARPTAKVIRFGLVGVANTGIDVGLFTLLHGLLQVPLFMANFCSTSVAMAASYVLNARFTFAAKRFTRKQLALYIAVTAIGQWLLQPLIISLGLLIINQTFLHSWLSTSLALVAAKLGGVAVTMVWNFVLYNKIVFADSEVLADERASQ